MITFRIDGLPPSYNRMFNINYNFREIYLSDEARHFKTKVKFAVPFFSVTTADTYGMDIEYHSNFKTKCGKNKKIDTHNCDKLLIDAIFEKLGIDDSYLWERREKKIQDKETYTMVTIRKLDNVTIPSV